MPRHQLKYLVSSGTMTIDVSAPTPEKAVLRALKRMEEAGANFTLDDSIRVTPKAGESVYFDAQQFLAEHRKV